MCCTSTSRRNDFSTRFRPASRILIGTPIFIPSREFIDIGRVASIENNHKPIDYAKKGQKVAIKIVASNSEEQQKMFQMHFEIDDELKSMLVSTTWQVTHNLAAKAFQTSLSLCRETFFSATMEDLVVRSMRCYYHSCKGNAESSLWIHKYKPTEAFKSGKSAAVYACAQEHGFKILETGTVSQVTNKKAALIETCSPLRNKVDETTVLSSGCHADSVYKAGFEQAIHQN